MFLKRRKQLENLWRHVECICHRSSLIGRGRPTNQKEEVCHCQDVEVYQHPHAAAPADMLVFPPDYSNYPLTDGNLHFPLSFSHSESPSAPAKSTSATISASTSNRNFPLRTWPNKTPLLLFLPDTPHFQYTRRNFRLDNARHLLEEISPRIRTWCDLPTHRPVTD